MDPTTTEIYTLSLHDALPICRHREMVGTRAAEFRTMEDRLTLAQFVQHSEQRGIGMQFGFGTHAADSSRSSTGNAKNADRKSTRLNSSHPSISYAVFCLKKKT